MAPNIAKRFFRSNSSGGSDATANSSGRKEATADGVEVVPTNENTLTVLNEANAVEHTAYTFSTKKKWWILTVVALCQTSMSRFPQYLDRATIRHINKRQTSMLLSTPMQSDVSMNTTTSEITTSPTPELVWPGS